MNFCINIYSNEKGQIRSFLEEFYTYLKAIIEDDEQICTDKSSVTFWKELDRERSAWYNGIARGRGSPFQYIWKEKAICDENMRISRIKYGLEQKTLPFVHKSPRGWTHSFSII